MHLVYIMPLSFTYDGPALPPVGETLWLCMHLAVAPDIHLCIWRQVIGLAVCQWYTLSCWLGIKHRLEAAPPDVPIDEVGFQLELPMYLRNHCFSPCSLRPLYRELCKDVFMEHESIFISIHQCIYLFLYMLIHPSFIKVWRFVK